MIRIAVVIGCECGTAKLLASDRAAVALALSWDDADVTVFAVDPEAGYYARAAGAHTLKAGVWLSPADFDVVLFGRGGCGEEGDLLPARIAEQHDASLIYEVVEIQSVDDGLNVTRDLGRGARDVLRVRGPVVLEIADSAARGRYVSQYRIDRMKRAHPARVTERDTQKLMWQPTTPRVRLGDHVSRIGGRAVDRLNALFGLGENRSDPSPAVVGDAEDCARQLFRYLCHHGFVTDAAEGEASRDTGITVESCPETRQHRRPAGDSVSLPARMLRRPRPLDGSVGAVRGPFRLGVDIDGPT